MSNASWSARRTLRPRWAGVEFRDDLWSFVDNELAYVFGPYFNDPMHFAEVETAYLHFESLYVRRDFRHRRVGSALVDTVADIGLPVYCQFASEFLEPSFARRTPEDAMEALEMMIERPAAALAADIELASSGGGPQTEIATGPLSIHFVVQYWPSQPGSHIRDIDQAEGILEDRAVELPEGQREPDLQELSDDARRWEFDDDSGWLGETVEEEIRYALRSDRSGIAVEKLSLETLTAPAFGSSDPARYELLVEGAVEQPSLLAARASWRRFLAFVERPWQPETLEEALTELLRNELFEIGQARPR